MSALLARVLLNNVRNCTLLIFVFSLLFSSLVFAQSNYISNPVVTLQRYGRTTFTWEQIAAANTVVIYKQNGIIMAEVHPTLGKNEVEISGAIDGNKTHYTGDVYYFQVMQENLPTENIGPIRVTYKLLLFPILT